MGKQGPASTGWLEYLQGHIRARYGDLDQQRSGAKARFVVESGIDAGSISRYITGERMPDIATCRKIAKAIRRPILEVLVAAGHLERDEIRMRDVPAVSAAEPLSPALERLRRLRENPKLDRATRERLDDLLSGVDDLVERPDRTG